MKAVVSMREREREKERDLLDVSSCILIVKGILPLIGYVLDVLAGWI